MDSMCCGQEGEVQGAQSIGGNLPKASQNVDNERLGAPACQGLAHWSLLV